MSLRPLRRKDGSAAFAGITQDVQLALRDLRGSGVDFRVLSVIMHVHFRFWGDEADEHPIPPEEWTDHGISRRALFRSLNTLQKSGVIRRTGAKGPGTCATYGLVEDVTKWEWVPDPAPKKRKRKPKSAPELAPIWGGSGTHSIPDLAPIRSCI